MNLRDQILSVADIKPQPVEVPEWMVDGKPLTVYLKPMTAAERLQFTLAAYGEDGKYIKEGSRGRMLAAILCDADGGRLFTTTDIEALEAKNGRVIERLYDAAWAMTIDEEKKVDAAEKNS